MPKQWAALVGGVVGAVAAAGIVGVLFWLFKVHWRTLSRGNSDTGSSDPSAPAELRIGAEVAIGAQASSAAGEVREFTLEQLAEATKGFEEGSVIGSGSFGIVYKGLLYDGTVAAIKRRPGGPRLDFSVEVARLSKIQHRNVVSLLGFCQQSGFQALVFEYLPNGSICNHLYDSGQGSGAQLEFKQRVSIALGVAKGLCHLHGLDPPVVHKNFKTGKVLVDENFIAKVADAGLVDLLNKIGVPPSSSQSSSFDFFHDPWADKFGGLSKQSDVYSYGIFVLELIIGRQVSTVGSSHLGQNISKWVERTLSGLEDLIDVRLNGRFTAEGMKGLIEVVHECTVSRSGGRPLPLMEGIVGKVEDILEKEIGFTPGGATVTLGSQLFTS